MPKFSWEGRTKSGDIRTGQLEATDDQAVIAALRRQRITPVKVKKAPIEFNVKIPGFEEQVTTRQIVIFTRQLATMIEAGLPLVQCLEILSSQEEGKRFKQIISKVKSDVESGANFSDALGRHPDVFNGLFVNLISAGEAGGMLDVILIRLAQYIEKAEALKKKVKGALVYPMSIVAIAVIVTAILLIFVIPVFESMFSDFGAELPGPTKVVIALSDFAKAYVVYIIAGAVAFVVAFRRFYKTSRGRWIVDENMLRMPVFGLLLRKVAVSRFSRTLGTLISSGVPILDGLEICAGVAGNVKIAKALRDTRSAVSEGKTLAEPLRTADVFPTMVVQMVGVGETTGNLDGMLTKIADFYDEEVDNAVASLTSLLEPILMVFLGITVGGMLIAMYLPIFTLAANLS
ncbi:MAG: type II secretion system F family protein [Myxococcales bacterium]|nr:type II secretion system F family protein [Myxococcales bacterium]